MSLIERLRQAQITAQQIADPWLAPLQRVRGKAEFDGLERVSSQTLLDVLEVPQRSRRAGTYRRLAKLMAELGWTAVRVRDLTRGGFKEQVRGYVRAEQMDQCRRAYSRKCMEIVISYRRSPMVREWIKNHW
jgi:hypothetical protein